MAGEDTDPSSGSGSHSGTDPDSGSSHGPHPDLEADPGRVGLLREVAEEVRGDSTESEQVAAFLYRVSDLYDPDEETTPRDVYLNMRTILQVKECGGLSDRD